MWSSKTAETGKTAETMRLVRQNSFAKICGQARQLRQGIWSGKTAETGMWSSKTAETGMWSDVTTETRYVVKQDS